MSEPAKKELRRATEGLLLDVLQDIACSYVEPDHVAIFKYREIADLIERKETVIFVYNGTSSIWMYTTDTYFPIEGRLAGKLPTFLRHMPRVNLGTHEYTIGSGPDPDCTFDIDKIYRSYVEK